jgi:hypothetical protein
MPNLSSIDYRSLFYLFKGEPGTRKSTCALSFPTPQYWVSWDQKMEALGLPARNWGVDLTQVDYDDYGDWDAAHMKLKSFRTSCKYKTIIIDSITSGSNYINRQTMAKKASGQGGEAKGKFIGGIQVPGIEEFNAEGSALGELISLLQELKKARRINVVLIAHVIQRERKSEDGQTHMSRSIVTAGKVISQLIPAYAAEMYHFNIKEGAIVGKGAKYGLLTTHTGDDSARTTLPLPEEIMFGNEPLYTKWILPAVEERMKNPPPVMETTPKPTPNQT